MTNALNSTIDALHRRATAVTEANSEPGGAVVQPPTVAAQSPLHELLIDEVTAAVPSPLTERLRAATTVSAVHDWIAAAAMYNWIKADNELARQFLADLGNRPADAGLALAKAVARTVAPPPHDSRVLFLDRIGLLLEVVVAAIIALGRGTWFCLLASWMGASRSGVGFLDVVRQAWVPDLLAREATSLVMQAFGTILGACWLLLECRYAPRVLQGIRDLPLRQLVPRAYQHWRHDALHTLWCVQLLAVQAALTWQLAATTLGSLSDLSSVPTRAALVATCLTVALASCAKMAARLLQ